MITDRFHPIVVKELRQGLKSRAFTLGFLGLQVLMALGMFLFLAAVFSNSGDLDFVNGFFWFVLGLILLVFMPLRAFQCLYQEVRGETLELLLLTRMNARDIAFGKWMALAVQSLLLVSAVLPYLVLRYFLGSIDLTHDLLTLLLLFGGSLLLLAIGVGLSSWTSRLLRGLLILGAVLSFNVVPLLMYEIFDSGPLSGPGMAQWPEFLLLTWSGVMVAIFFIEYGASQIAPPAENHALRKRLAALLFLGGLLLYGVTMGVLDDELSGMAMLLLLPVVVDALSEALPRAPSAYRLSRRFGILRWFFLPGWVSGVFFVCLLLVGFGALVAFEATFTETINAMCVIFFNLLLPVAVIRSSALLSRYPLAAFLLITIAMTTMGLFLVFLWEIDFIRDAPVWFQFFPLFSLLPLLDDVDEMIPGLLAFPCTLVGLWLWCCMRTPLFRIHSLLRPTPS